MSKKKLNRQILAVVSDTHAGHKLGLCNPNVELLLEDEVGAIKQNAPVLTEVQRYLWELYAQSVQQVLDLADGDKLTLCHLGDVTQGTRFPSELLTTSLSEQIKIAQANMQVWLGYKNLQAIRIAKGTGVHSFGEGSSELILAELLKQRVPNTAVMYHGLLDLGGVLIDYAHHGPAGGTRVWLTGNEVRLYLRSLVMGELQSGNRPPNLVLRGHTHIYAKEFMWTVYDGKEHESWMMVIPSMCMLGEHGHKVTKSVHKLTNGIMAVEIIEGQIHKLHFMGKTLDIRTKEVL